MRVTAQHMLLIFAVLLAAPSPLRAQPVPLVRVQNGGNPLLGRWVSTDLSQSTMVYVKRTDMIFSSNYTVTAISYKTDGTVKSVSNRYGIQHVAQPDEGYLWLFSSANGLETRRRCEFRIYNGLLYISSPETGLMVFKRKGK